MAQPLPASSVPAGPSGGASPPPPPQLKKPLLDKRVDSTLLNNTGPAGLDGPVPRPTRNHSAAGVRALTRLPTEVVPGH